VKLNKIIARRVRGRADGVDVAGDVNAAISVNAGERGAATWTSSRQGETAQERDPNDQPATAGGSDERRAEG
jgi:hypothetical protein